MSHIKSDKKRGWQLPLQVNHPNPIILLYKALIVYYRIKIKILKEKGKEYPWVKPCSCLKCHSKRLWGWGFVYRYFIGEVEGVWLKRYRCPECGTIYTLRPIQHFRGFWHGWFVVIASLLSKLKKGRWLKEGASRQAQQYWWKSFLKQISKRENSRRNLCSLRLLLKMHTFPATCSLKYFEIKSICLSTNRIFALTPAHEYG